MNPLPHSSEYERSVLSLILDGTTPPMDRAEVFDALEATDFYDPRHQEVFSTCLDLHHRRQPIDIVTALDALDRRKVPDAAVLLGTITDFTIPAPDVAHYCDRLRDYAKARAMIALFRSRIRELEGIHGGTVGEVGDMIDRIQGETMEIGARGQHRFLEPPELLGIALDEYRRLGNQAGLDTLKTGFSVLDEVVALRGSRLVIIAARPSIGKTALALSIARNMCKAGISTAFFSLEMDRQDVTDRLIAQEADINLLQLNHGSGPGPDAWKGIMEAGNEIHSWPLLLDDRGGLPIGELKRGIRQACRQGAKIVFVDQLSQIRGPGQKEYERNTFIVQELAKLKKEIGVPIILLCQISRKQDEAQNKAPALHMLKTTGALEEEADIVLLIDRPYEYNHEAEQKNGAFVSIAKNRNGAKTHGKGIELFWSPSRAMFRNKMG